MHSVLVMLIAFPPLFRSISEESSTLLPRPSSTCADRRLHWWRSSIALASDNAALWNWYSYQKPNKRGDRMDSVSCSRDHNDQDTRHNQVLPGAQIQPAPSNTDIYNAAANVGELPFGRALMACATAHILHSHIFNSHNTCCSQSVQDIPAH